ncbi:unnamed protein product, partial [Cercopithifilaria johnstoni]
KVLDEYGTEIFKEPTIERERLKTESWKEPEEVVDQLSRMEDLEETETKPLEDIIPVRKVLDEYGTEIFKEPTIERERLKTESWKEPEEVVDQLSRMEDLEETESQSLGDIIPSKEFEEYGEIVSKERSTGGERVTDMKAEVELEVMDQLSRMEDLEETETKALEDIISVRKVLDEYGTEIFKEPTIERERLKTESWKEPEEVVDQLSRMEDLEETETKALEDIISVRKVLDEYGTEIFDEPTIEREHFETESWEESEEAVSQLSRMEDLEETKIKSFGDVIPGRQIEEYGEIVSKEPTKEGEYVTDMKAPVGLEIMDQLSRMEDLGESEAKPLEDIISVRKVLDEYGIEIFEEPTIESEHLEAEIWKESEEIVDQLSRTEDLEETEREPFEHIIRARGIFEEHAISVSEFTQANKEHVSSQNMRYKVPVRSNEHTKQYGDIHVADTKTECFQTKLVKFARDATAVAGGIVASPIVLAKLGVSKVYDNISGDDGDMQMVSEKASSMIKRDGLKGIQSEADDVNEEKTSVQCDDNIGRNVHLELSREEYVPIKEHQITLSVEVPSTKRVMQEYVDDVVPTAEGENRSPEIYKTTLFDHEILEPRAEIQYQLFTEKDSNEIKTKSTEDIVAEYCVLQNFDISLSKEIITREDEEPSEKEIRYPKKEASMEEMLRKDLKRTEAQKFKDILQQECGASMLKELITEEVLMMKQKTFLEQEYSVPQTEEKKHIPLEGKESIVTPSILYERIGSEGSACILEKEIKNQQPKMGDSEEFEVKLSEKRVSKNAKSEGVGFERVVSQKFAEELGIVKEYVTMGDNKEDRFGIAEEVIKGQIVEKSLTDTICSCSDKETEFSGEASSDIDRVKEKAGNGEAFLRSPEIQSGVGTVGVAPAKEKEKCIDTESFLRDVLISSRVSFADLVDGLPAHKVDDMIGTEAEQSRTGDRNLQKMGESTFSLTTECLLTKEDIVGLSKEKIISQQMCESSKEGVEKPPEYQLEQNTIYKKVTPVEETEKVEERSPFRFPKKKGFETKEVLSESSPFLDRNQECKDIIIDVEHSKTNSDAETRKKLNLEDQPKGQQLKDEKFAEENGTVTREIILTPAALMTFDTVKVCDYSTRSDIGETSIKQLPDTDYQQLTPPTATEQHDEAAMMQAIVAEKQILKKEIDYDLIKNLNEPVQSDEKVGVDSMKIIEPFAVETCLDRGLIKLDESESEITVSNAQDKLRYPAMDIPSPADQNAIFISSDVKMNISLPKNVYKVSENGYMDEVLVGNLRVGMQADVKEEVVQDDKVQPVVAASNEGVEERVTVRTELAESKEISFNEMMSEEETSYESVLNGTSCRNLCVDEKMRPFSGEGEYPCEVTVDTLWTPEEKEGIDVEVGLEKQESFYTEEIRMYPSGDTINVAMRKERVSGNIAEEGEEESNVEISGGGDESSPKFEAMKWKKLTNRSEMTSERNELIGDIECDKEFKEQFTFKVPEAYKEETESFSIDRSEPKEHEIKLSEITVEKNVFVECQGEFIIQGQQISELTRNEKLKENVDAMSLEMLDRDQKDSEKRLITVEGDQELIKEAQAVQNYEEIKFFSGDGITTSQQPFGVSASDDKTLSSIKESPEQLTAKHDLMTLSEEGKLKEDVRNRMKTSSSCEPSMEEQRNIASRAFLDTIEVCSAIPQQSESIHVLEKGSAGEQSAAEDQESFLGASSDVSNSSVEKRKKDEKVSYCEEGPKRYILRAEGFVEPSNGKVIYGEVSDMLWQQTEVSENKRTASGKQLDLALKEKSTAEVENEKNLTLSNLLDRYPAEQHECREFTLQSLHLNKERKEDPSSFSFSSMFPSYAEDTQTKSLREIERTESLEVTTVADQQRMDEKIIINKSSHLAKECREIKKGVCEMGSIRDDDKREKLEAITSVEPTSDPDSEESLILIKAPLARQKIDREPSEMDEKAKIVGSIDLEANAEHLIGESIEKLDQTTSRSSNSFSIDSSIEKYSDGTSPFSNEKATIGKSVPQVQHEHEEDYESDLKEKLETLAKETKKLKRHLEGCSLLNEDEKNQKEFNIQVIEMVDDIMKPVESLSRTESTYKTATVTSRDGYETCVTSQEDTFETAPSYHSQESDYTTATSEDSSRLSGMNEERRESATPIAIFSPVESDRLFTASQDEEQKPNRQGSEIIDSKRSSPDVPDIELVSVEDEGNILLTTPSGILLAPDVDPGRPVSPVPPGFSDEDESFVAVATASDSSRKAVDQQRQAEIKILDSIVEAPGDDTLADKTFSSRKREVPDLTTFQESMHANAMDFGKEFFPQYSDLSTKNKTRTVHTIEKKDETIGVALPSEAVLCIESDSLDSLDKLSIKSGSSGKKYNTSRRSSTSSRKSSHDEPQTFVERLTPELKMSWVEKNQEVESVKQSSLPSSEEYPMFMSESEQMNPVEVELETVDEEPEEADSLNGRSVSSNGQGTDISVTVGKYKTVSSDNVSETSLQEFERIERDVLNKGESSLSGSEVELYVAGKLKTVDGSTSSLAEFERLEQEVVAEGSPQDEVMILSDIREESEVEEMSIRDDDEEEHDSISDIKAVPVEEDTQVATPMASPTDSIERDFENFVPEAMGTSIDSLEINVPPVYTPSDLGGENYLTEYEVIEKVHGDIHDSLEIIPQDKDSMLEEANVRGISQDGQVILSGDTYEEKDSLAGDIDSMLHDYPTTLTTFETMQIKEDGSTEIISRRVLTRVTDPIISHVQFTGTENEHRVRDLEREEEFETMDIEGNVTRTTLHRNVPSSSAGASHSAHRG